MTAGREYASADVSERTLHEIYLPPFAAAVAARVAAVMPAFIDIAGVPMTANAKLLQGWLRGVAGFDGVVISDYNAVAELLNHGVAADLVEAAALALNAGVDIDMTSGAYVQRPARGAEARSRNDGRDRRERQARARAEGAPRPVRRSLSARVDRACSAAQNSGTARAGARGGDGERSCS